MRSQSWKHCSHQTQHVVRRLKLNLHTCRNIFGKLTSKEEDLKNIFPKFHKISIKNLFARNVIRSQVQNKTRLAMRLKRNLCFAFIFCKVLLQDVSDTHLCTKCYQNWNKNTTYRLGSGNIHIYSHKVNSLIISLIAVCCCTRAAGSFHILIAEPVRLTNTIC